MLTALKRHFLSFAAIAALCVPAVASATTLDVSGAGASGSINTLVVDHVDLATSSGTGTFDPFVRIQGNNSEQGFNTSGTVRFDTKSGTWTTDLLLSDLPVVIFGGTSYLEFALDLGEPGGDGSPNSLLDVTEAQVFVSPTGGQSPTTFGTLHGGDILDIAGSLVYDLDSNGDNRMVILGDTTSGNGRIDYLFYLPASLFEADGAPFVYFYSAYANSGGTFEEWGTCRSASGAPQSCLGNDGTTPPAQVPQPGTAILLGAGLLALAPLALGRLAPRPVALKRRRA